MSKSLSCLYASPSLLSLLLLPAEKDSHVGRLEGPVEGLDDLLLVRDLIDVFRAAGGCVEGGGQG